MGFHMMAGWRGGLSRRSKVANGLLLAALTLPVPTLAQSDGVPPAGVVGGSEAAVAPKSVGETATEGVRSEESLARFEALLQRRPLHAAAFAGLVDHYTERGKLGDLVGEYQAKVTALPDDVPLKIVLARLQLRAGDPAAAAKTLETVGGLRDEMARHGLELMLFQAEVRQRGGDDAGAERVLEEAQRQAVSVSDRTKVGEALADLRLRQGRKDDAVKVFEVLAAEFPDNYTHQKRMAESLSQRGLHEAAVARCKATLPLVREEADRRCEVLRQLGMSLEKLSRGEEAIAA